MMVPDNQERHKTAYTVTVDYKHGGASVYYAIVLYPHYLILSFKAQQLGSLHMIAA